MKFFISFILFSFYNISLFSQIHFKNKWLVCPDKYNQQIFIYDANKGNLVKTVFFGEKIRFTSFNEDESKFYAITKNYLQIVDMTNFQIEKVQLLTTLGIGVSKKGFLAYYGGGFKNFENRTIDYNIQDISKKPISFVTLTEPHMGVFFNGLLYIPYQDGSCKVIDVDTKESKIYSNIIDTAMASEIKLGNPAEPLDIAVEAYGNYLLSNIYNGRIKAVSIYDIKQKKIVFSEPYLFKFEELEIIPLACLNTTNSYFIKKESINNGVKPERPIYPETPDYNAMDPKEVKKATKEFDLKVTNYEKELLAYETKYAEFLDFKNIRTKVYSDIACTNEIFSIEGAKFIRVEGDYIIAEKEFSVELHDITNKKLVMSFIHAN